MSIFYEEHEKRFVILEKRSEQVSAHVHNHFEFLMVTSGSLDLGIGQKLYHMEKGDFAMVFPDLVHYYRVPQERGRRRSVYILADPNFAGSQFPLYAKQCPADPVIPADRVHPDIPYAVRQLVREKDLEGLDDVRYAYSLLILARAMPEYQMIDQSEIGSAEMVYQTVKYMATHFNENISLTDAASALGISRYALSRIISQELHTNFNRYLNKLRIDHAVNLLLYTDQSITEICFRCGFESQRTFNRAFKEYKGMTPREYRRSRALLPEDDAEDDSAPDDGGHK